MPRSWFYSMPLTLAAVSMALTSFYGLLLELPLLAGRRTAHAEALELRP